MLLVLALLVSCGADKHKDTETDAPELPPEPTATEGLVYAEDGLGNCSVIDYKGDSTEIYIPAVYGGFNVTAVADSAFRGNDLITEVILGANVESVGVAAFAGCDSLVSVVADESLEKVGSAAFFGCDSLTGVTLPDGLTAIGDSAFASCHGLTSVTLPDSLTDIGKGAFDGCSDLLTFTVGRDSWAKQYCIDNGLSYTYPDAPDWLND